MKYQLTQWISMFQDVVGPRKMPFMHLSKNNRATSNCIYRIAALLVRWCRELPWSMQKANYLRRESRLEFALSYAKRVPLELWCQPKGYLAVQYQKPPMQIQCAMYMYIYIYCLCNSCIPRWYLYINIYMKNQLTQWTSMFQDFVGQPTLPVMH